MSSIRELREKLQAPRRAVDTWYGRNVMRRMSIYCTWFFLNLNFTPNQVTLLSLVAALIGACFFIKSHFGLGILSFNLWYLLDHADGEMARAGERSSATGFYFDTIINFIVQPLTFFGLGCGLAMFYPGSWILGLVGAFASLMLMIVPMCEDAVMFEMAKSRGLDPRDQDDDDYSPKPAPSIPHQIFSLWHRLITYPVVLALISFSYLGLFFLDALAFEPRLLRWVLFFYAVSATAIWILQLTHKILFKKIDQPPLLEKEPLWR